MNKIVAVSVAAAVPTAAPAMPSSSADDPIFAAIDAYCLVEEACDAVQDDDILEQLGDRWSDAYHLVLQTRPTTPAGLSALATWSRERTNWLHTQGSTWLTWHLCNLFSTLDDAARGMSGLKPWSPPTQPSEVTQVDAKLIRAARDLAAIDQAFEDIHRERGHDANFLPLGVRRNENIATLITVPAKSQLGFQAKASALRLSAMMEDWSQHQQLAVSLANDLVGAATTTAPAMPDDQLNEASEAMDRAAALARMEQIVDLLRTCYVREGWKLDDVSAEQALEFLRRYAKDGSETDEGREAFIDFVRSHAQSLDWVLCGDIGGMVCGLAKNSEQAQSMTPIDPIFAAIERARLARAQSKARYALVSKCYKKAKKRRLADRDAFVEAEIGCHPDSFTDETATAYWAAADELFEVEPTTLPGVLAQLQFADELIADKDRDLVEENAAPLVSSLLAAVGTLVRA